MRHIIVLTCFLAVTSCQDHDYYSKNRCWNYAKPGEKFRGIVNISYVPMTHTSMKKIGCSGPQIKISSESEKTFFTSIDNHFSGKPFGGDQKMIVKGVFQESNNGPPVARIDTFSFQ
jgi:hypothetical protein